MPLIDHNLKAKLLDRRVSILHHPPFGLPDRCILEPPCSLKWMVADYSLVLGAFSYAVSGYYFFAEIGRYVSIGEQVQVGRGSHPVRWASTSPVFYQSHESVVDFKMIEAESFQANAPYIAPKPTIIGNDVYIGHGAFIMQGIRIGDGAVVGANSVVTKDVPNYAVVAGNPATVRRMRFSENIVERFEATPWWKYAFWDLSGLPIADPEAFIAGVEDRVAQNMRPYAPALIDVKTLI